MHYASSYFLAWQRADRAATAAERTVFNYQRNLAFSHEQGATFPKPPSKAEEAEAVALRAMATELLRIFLEETRARAALLREHW